VIFREERVEDIDAISAVVEAAFRTANPHGTGDYIPTEHLMVDALRSGGALTLGLVAEDGGAIVGHVAFSPVLIDGRSQGWHGLAPLAVRPDRQKGGIGAGLIREGLVRLAAVGSKGCVVLGDPGYYSRFGFAAHAQLRLEGVPPQYFMAQSFGDPVPGGVVTYHDAFTRPHTP
jgi:putative acetyltransferase